MAFRQFGPKVRVESGPARKVAVATKELLDDSVTATHYKVGQPDALNKIIVLGEEMNYLDWPDPKGFVWYVYELRPVVVGSKTVVGRDGTRKAEEVIRDKFMPVANYRDEAKAYAKAEALAREIAEGKEA